MTKEPLSVTAEVLALMSLLGLISISGSTVPFQEIISVSSHSGVLVPAQELALFPRVDATLVRRYGNPDSSPILS